MINGRLLIHFLYGILLHLTLFVKDASYLDVAQLTLHPTNQCPQNETERNNRATAISCTDTGNYMCIPDNDLMELFEFCFPLYSVRIGKGRCLTVYNKSNVLEYNCQSFVAGCPEKKYHSDELFKYPNCSAIRNGCFHADMFCVSSNASTCPPENPLREPTETISHWYRILTIFSVLVNIGICCSFGIKKIVIWSKKVKKKNDEVGLGDEKTVDQKEAVPLRQYNSIGQDDKETDDRCTTNAILEDDENHSNDANVTVIKSRKILAQVHVRKPDMKCSKKNT
ncbi:uncharacterized protein LOC144621999 isoform X2 [Crassostrea virginica]